MHYYGPKIRAGCATIPFNFCLTTTPSLAIWCTNLVVVSAESVSTQRLLPLLLAPVIPGTSSNLGTSAESFDEAVWAFEIKSSLLIVSLIAPSNLRSFSFPPRFRWESLEKNPES